MRQLFAGLKSGFSTSRTHRPRARLLVEGLERRDLLSVSSLFSSLTGIIDRATGVVDDVQEYYRHLRDGSYDELIRQFLPPPVADAPLRVVGVPIFAAEGEEFSGLVGLFRDRHAPADADNYSAVIEWGDGETSAAEITANDRGGFDVTGTHTFTGSPPELPLAVPGLDRSLLPDVGVYFVSFKIHDEADNVDAESRTLALVKPAPPSGIHAEGRRVSATAGEEFTAVVAAFKDSDDDPVADDYEATIDWGDGTTSTGVISARNTEGFVVSGTHTYESSNTDPALVILPEAGIYQITVKIEDTGENDIGEATSWAVVEQPPSPLEASGRRLHALVGESFTEIVASFSDAHPNESAESYTATIDWGDGETSEGVIRRGERHHFIVSGAHTYDSLGEVGRLWQHLPPEFDGHSPMDSGLFLITVKIEDTLDNITASAQTVAVVEAPPPDLHAVGVPVHAVVGQEFTAVVAHFRDRNDADAAEGYKAVISWGDGASSDGTIAANSEGGFTVTGSHTYASAGNDRPELLRPGLGTFEISVSISSADGDAATAHAFAVVEPAASSISAIGVPVHALHGQEFTAVVARFRDSDAEADLSNYAATIHWGDGQTSEGVIGEGEEGGLIVEGTHTYTAIDEVRILPIPYFAHFAIAVRIESKADGDSAAARTTASVEYVESGIRAVGVPVRAVAGEEFTAVVARFHERDDTASVENYLAIINWGDGETSESVVAANDDGGFDVSGTHSYAGFGARENGLFAPDHGFFPITVTITDKVDGDSATTRSTAFVLPGHDDDDDNDGGGLIGEGRRIHAIVSVEFEAIVARFSDTDSARAASYSAVIHWGDETTSAGKILRNNDGSFDVFGSHTYTAAGRSQVVVAISDVDGDALRIESRAVVRSSARPPEPIETPVITRTGVAFLSNLFADLSEITETALIDFGDGSGLLPLNLADGILQGLDHHYEAAGIYDVTVRVEDELGEFLTRIIPVNVLPSDSALFIASNIADLLGREVEEEDLELVEETLEPGRQRIFQQVAGEYISASESRAHLIADYYQTFLNRTAGETEVNYWVQALQQGATPEVIIGQFLASSEYSELHGGDDASWLNGVYEDLLGRLPDSDFFLTSLDTGADRGDVADVILDSPEYLNRLIATTYVDYLNREAGAADLDYWRGILGQLPQGPGSLSPYEQFLTGVLGSSEYVDLNGDTIDSWVTTIYETLLDRPPDEAGFDYAVTRLLDGTTALRQQVAMTLATGEEHASQEIAGWYQRFLSRDASAVDLTYWLGVLQQGASDEQILAAIAGSEEALGNQGGDAAAWLDQIYAELLGRERQGSETFFLDHLGTDQLSYEDVVERILSSEEFGRGLIGDFYRDFLERDASIGEIDYWFGTLQNGAADEDILASILGSREYFLNNQQGI